MITTLRLTPKNQAKRGERRARQNKRSVVVSIPKLISSLKVTKTFRYLAASSQSTPTGVTRAMLLNSLFMNISSSTSNYRLAIGVRLVRIRAYLPAAGTIWNGSSSLVIAPQLTITWNSNNSPSESVTESNGGSTMQTAVFKPPKDSLASFWSASSQSESESLLFYQTSAGVLIDCTLQIIIGSQIEIATSVTTASSGSAGKVYNSYFDGPATGAVWSPVGVPSLN